MTLLVGKHLNVTKCGQTQHTSVKILDNTKIKRLSVAKRARVHDTIGVRKMTSPLIQDVLLGSSDGNIRK